MSNYALVVDTNREPLTPCKPSRARKLLNSGKAAVLRRHPFTIILNKQVDDNPDTCHLKLDPGSKTTGIALLKGNKVVWAAELSHRSEQIRTKMEARRAARRNRRYRKVRYRKPRFLNRRRPSGWLPPSLKHRVQTTMSWVQRLTRFCAVGGITQELAKFDTQRLQNPEIVGVEYQQGELAGYELREYLLEKWGRQCAYCQSEGVPLQIEHIFPKSRGGSDRASNLTLACDACNKAKGNQDIHDFLADRPALLERIKVQAKAPLKDAAAINATRWALFRQLKATGLTVTVGTGGQTKFNRSRLGLSKAHWIDAAAAGPVEALTFATAQPLLVQSQGQPTRFKTLIDKHGFPRAYRTAPEVWNGIKAGDWVKATVPNGKSQGTWVGCVAGIRQSRPPAIKPFGGKQLDLTAQTEIRLLHCRDGYEYGF